MVSRSCLKNHASLSLRHGAPRWSTNIGVPRLSSGATARIWSYLANSRARLTACSECHRHVVGVADHRVPSGSFLHGTGLKCTRHRSSRASYCACVIWRYRTPRIS
eukprot:6933078-Prymnesium_polylepis.1